MQKTSALHQKAKNPKDQTFFGVPTKTVIFFIKIFFVKTPPFNKPLFVNNFLNGSANNYNYPCPSPEKLLGAVHKHVKNQKVPNNTKEYSQISKRSNV